MFASGSACCCASNSCTDCPTVDLEISGLGGGCATFNGLRTCNFDFECHWSFFLNTVDLTVSEGGYTITATSFDGGNHVTFSDTFSGALPPCGTISVTLPLVEATCSGAGSSYTCLVTFNN